MPVADPPQHAPYPWETRDQQEQTEILYGLPLRLENRRLKDEIFQLKRQLRESGVSIDSVPQDAAGTGTPARRVTRSSINTSTQQSLNLGNGKQLLPVTQWELWTD
jgi:hypothetical protein